jgi:hypothetical protein
LAQSLLVECFHFLVRGKVAEASIFKAGTYSDPLVDRKLVRLGSAQVRFAIAHHSTFAGSG